MAIFDSFLKAFGVPTAEELGEARVEKNRVTQSQEPRDRFAAAVADALSPMSRDDAKRTFQGLNDVQLSGHVEVRWAATAAAAHRIADESVAKPQQSLDAPLSRAVGERALSEAAENVAEKARYGMEPGARIESMLERKREMVARETRAFMSTGTAAQKNANQQANDMIFNGDQTAAHKLRQDVGDVVGQPTAATRREWVQKATEARLAAAQVGALPANRTVEAAMDASRQGHMVEGRIAQTPDRARTERLQGQDRAAVIRDQVERNKAPTQSMRQQGVNTEEQIARHGITATTKSTSVPSKADHAAIARSMSDAGRNH